MLRHLRLFVLTFLAAIVLLVNLCAADGPFDYFENSWNVIGLKDYAHGTRVTPDNKLLLANKRTVQIRVGRRLTLLSRKQTKTLLEGWLPVVLLSEADGPICWEIRLWATPLPSVKDWKKAFDGPAEGENFLNWIQVEAVNTSDKPADARGSASRKPARRRPAAANTRGRSARKQRRSSRSAFPTNRLPVRPRSTTKTPTFG